jgi:hypothetical protein
VKGDPPEPVYVFLTLVLLVIGIAAVVSAYVLV